LDQNLQFQILKNGVIALGMRVYLPKYKVLKDEILREDHESRLEAQSGSTKMYRDLKKNYGDLK
jgi:hypothetical protein